MVSATSSLFVVTSRYIDMAIQYMSTSIKMQPIRSRDIHIATPISGTEQNWHTHCGNGTRTQQGSTMVCTGFNGTAYINGTDVTVTIRGSGVDLMAEGKGRALLA